MKKLLSIIICVSMVLAGCTAGGGAASTGASGDSASAEGGTAEVTTETASETEESSAAEGENGSGSAGKPALEVIGEEEEDFDRAVKNRSAKKSADPNGRQGTVLCLLPNRGN